MFDRCLPSFVNGNSKNVSTVNTSSLFDDSEESGYNLTSVHDGHQSNFTAKFNKREEGGFHIVSIFGSVRKTKSEENEIQSNQTEIEQRQRRNVEDKIQDEEMNDYENIYNILDDDVNVTSKRDLSDAINVEVLKDGVEHLKQMLDLQSLSEKLLWDLSVYWWIMLLFLLLAFVLSFVWIGVVIN